MRNLEVEFKYPAEGVSLQEFKSYCQSRNPIKEQMILVTTIFMLTKVFQEAFIDIG